MMAEPDTSDARYNYMYRGIVNIITSDQRLSILMVLPLVIIITCTERHFVVFAVRLLDSETTKAAYSSIARAVVRAGKPFIVAAATCATACLALCRATAAHYIQKCLRSNWSCWYRRSDDGSVDAPVKVGNVSSFFWRVPLISCLWK